MKKVLSIFSLFLALTVQAGEVTTLPTTVVLAIEALGGNGTVAVPEATSSATVGTTTYFVCDIDATVNLTATANSGFLFQEWSGNDAAHAYNIVPTDKSNPYALTLYADAGFIQLSTTSWLDTVKIKASFRDATVCDVTFSPNGFFVTAVDALGSLLSIDSATTPPTINYDQVWKTAPLGANDWPWNDVGFHFSQEEVYPYYWDPTQTTLFQKLSTKVLAIQIAYKSEHVWKMILPYEASLMAAGGSHRVKLPVTSNMAAGDLTSTGMYEYTAYIDQFEWPEWYTDHSIPLVIDSVKQINFALDENAETSAYKGALQIESIKLCGKYVLGVEEAAKELKEIGINGLWNNSIHISSTVSETYNVAVYTMEGKMVFNTVAKLNQGANAINMNTNLQSGSYMIRVENNSGAQVKSIGMIK